MLKPKKGFVQAQLNIERLTPIQWDGIMRAMDAYAEHYNEEQVKKLNIPAVVGRSEQLLAFKKWEAEKCKLPWDASPEQIIEQYLSQ